MNDRLPIGSEISHYVIESRLGAGGMGEVYLASDQVLGRRVAIKFLAQQFEADRSARERFLREARAAARLTHPNVCGVYEIGEDAGRAFIVMQHVEGETLAERISRSGRLPPGEVVSVAADTATALAEAHSMNIVHRDIKSQNIMIDRRGTAVVLDFGLAKLTHIEGGVSDQLTGTGVVSGTVPYMSPEQLRGESLDGRSDIFSLGIVMYEALTGQRPFGGSTAAHVITAILTQEPRLPEQVAGEDLGALRPIVDRCLAKRREHRYADAHELAGDLLALGYGRRPSDRRDTRPDSTPSDQPQEATAIRSSSALSDSPTVVLRPRRAAARRKAIDSLAVLPFETASASTDAEFLSEGITETLIADLSRLPKLRVMARGTVFRYRGTELDPVTIGRQLGVRAVLSGRVQLAGERFVVRVELIDAVDGSVMWSEQYARRPTDIIELQEEIAREISTTLRPRLSPQQKKRVTARQTHNAEAHQRHLRGVYFLNRRDIGSMRKATEAFQEAIGLDSAFAAPYCGLAEAYIYFGFLEVQPPLDVFPAARAAALKALELDPSYAEAHAALGWMKVTHEWDWEGAEDELREAARLNPNCAMAHHWYGLLLSYTRRFDEALPKILLARTLDPLAPIVNIPVGATAWHRGDYAEALRIYDQVADMAPGFIPLRLYRGFAYESAGQHEQAVAEFTAGLDVASDETLLLSALAHCYGEMGRREEAEAILQRLIARRESAYTSAYGIALVSAGLGDRESAYRWLDAAYEERAAWLCTSYVDARWNSYRDDPRFRELMKKMRFPGA